jgi:hypothetical protein
MCHEAFDIYLDFYPQKVYTLIIGISFRLKEVTMFHLRKPHKNQEPEQQKQPYTPEHRTHTCRRVSFDTKYLGLGKCIDKRKIKRRKEDRFDFEAYERSCYERLGPGWL